LRIVAGELRGRRLTAPARGSGVRPTADRVREALFSILGDVDGDAVLDLFCGTGALAIEAISRGAARATLVDSHSQLARRNVEAVGLSDRCTVVGSDVVRYLRGTEDRFDLVFCDPPYRLADRLEGELASLIPERLAARGRVIMEGPVHTPLELPTPLITERRYGDTLIRIHGEDGR
jgi:16S rRNA (guanine966-N2)-methyltransferase